jgi:hypothetical protein
VPKKTHVVEQKGYASTRVGLNRDDGSFAVQLVARLMLLAFVGEPAPGQMARHLNGDSADNRAVNLAWGSSAENRADAYRHGTAYMPQVAGLPPWAHPGAKLTEEQWRGVAAARAAGERVKDIAARYGISLGHVSYITKKMENIVND